MLTTEVYNALNDQFNAELYSSRIYLAMAIDFAVSDLDGFESWMKLQAEEENEHAMKFYDYILSRGNKPVLNDIESPPNEWKSPLRALETALNHEEYVTSRINEIVTLAKMQNDHATQNFLCWFVKEQVEEEETLRGIISRTKMTESSPNGILFINKELAEREKKEKLKKHQYYKGC